jgi:hypothetical protein
MKKAIIRSVLSLLSVAGLARAEPPAPAPDYATLPKSSSTDKAGPEAVNNPSAAEAANDPPTKEAASVPSTNCFTGCCPCCPRCPRTWFSADYLMWWFKDAPEPVPFITTFPTGSASTPPGAIGQPDTQVLLGGSDIDSQTRHGGRFTIGRWINQDNTIGLEANYFFILNHGTISTVNSGGGPTAPVFVVPFIDALTGKQSVGPLLGGPINAPGLTSYRAFLSDTNHLDGAELNGIYKLNRASGDNLSVNLLGGFRWLQFNENLALGNSVTGNPGGMFPLAYDALDLFSTRNNFYGGQLGGRVEWVRGRVFVNASAKVALGDMHETVNINGVTRTNFFTGAGGAIQTFPGGVFTQPSNIGNYNFDRFAVIPEGTINVGYQLRDRARVYVGYTFLYVSDLARPGNQIDPTINTTRTNFANAAGIPPVGPARPAFNLNQSDFWAQGINFGIEFRF